MLENIIIQADKIYQNKADKSNVIVLINKNYYVLNIIIQKADKSNVIVLINKNYYVRKYHYTKSG